MPKGHGIINSWGNAPHSTLITHTTMMTITYVDAQLIELDAERTEARSARDTAKCIADTALCQLYSMGRIYDAIVIEHECNDAFTQEGDSEMFEAMCYDQALRTATAVEHYRQLKAAAEEVQARFSTRFSECKAQGLPITAED